ncbi:MAG: hypothetical protein GYA50_04090 [Eubacteriaceae bacterium]|nr:hypothetical protein [Eubacteriaceae bacterium]
MKLSQREAVLLFVLGIIVVIFVGLNFLIKPIISSNKEKQNTYDELNVSYTQMQSDIKLLGTIDQQIAQQYSNATAAALPFSLSIEQYDIDRFIANLVKENNLVQTSVKISEVGVSNADYYSEMVKDEKADTQIPIEQSAEIINGAKSASTNTNKVSTDGTNLMYCTTINLVVSGSHNNILSFADDLKKDGRAYVIDEVSISTSTESSTEKASFTIRFFKAPDIKLN